MNEEISLEQYISDIVKISIDMSIETIANGLSKKFPQLMLTELEWKKILADLILQELDAMCCNNGEAEGSSERE